MSSIVFIVNDDPHGSERPYNALRLAGVLVGKENTQGPSPADKVIVFRSYFAA